MYRHFLQSPAWETFIKSEGKSTFRLKDKDFEAFCFIESTSLGNYLYCPYGPVLSDKNPASALAHALKKLTELAKAQHCFFIRIEPTHPFTKKSLTPLGLKKSHDLNPAHTWVLDLSPDVPTLLSGFSQGTRTRHNQFPKKGLSVTVSTNPSDISHLTRLQHKLASEKGINTFSNSYLKNELSQPFASLFLVHYHDLNTKNAADHIISASLFFDDKENSTRYYMQSATDSEYKKLPATVGLLTSAIFDAKAKGLKNFDFWGIAPDDAKPSHPWAGFTAFKKSFGGSARTYSGTYDLPLSPIKYQFYRLLRALNRLRRRLF